VRKLLEIVERWWAELALGGVVMALRAALLPVWPIPTPTIYDEFSYLLQADTFAHGRLANPPHPLWRFFESIYILQQPTYASRYPPGQALMMATGQVLFGHPWFGIWLSCGLLAAAMLWALQGWAKGRVLWIGAGMIAQMCFFSHWMNSYWGGAVAATGSALVLGAAGRLRERVSAFHGIAFGVGAVILEYTRPFEGSLLLIVVFSWLLFVNRRREMALWVPVMLIGAAGAAWLGFYNDRVTGSPLRLPYQEYYAQYETVPPLTFLPLRDAREVTLRHFDQEWLDRDWSNTAWHKARSWEVFPKRVHEWSETLTIMLGSRLWILPLVIFWPMLLRNRETRLPALLIPLMVVTSFGLQSLFAHYAAPFTAAFLIIAVLGAERVGRLLPYPALLAAAVFAMMFGNDAVQIWNQRTPDRFMAVNWRRGTIAEQLAGEGEDRHVIFVRYTQPHSPHEEWIYNGADLDGARVLWAQDMGDDANRELMRYYAGRKFWMFEPDEAPDTLRPYEGGR
jgi:hypothetical protein